MGFPSLEFKFRDRSIRNASTILRCRDFAISKPVNDLVVGIDVGGIDNPHFAVDQIVIRIW